MPPKKLPHILVIAGPTASGKTSLAIKIAKEIPSEIISADSRQVFQYLDIGTSKPSALEMEVVPHHFISIVSPDQKFNAGDFESQGRKTIAGILGRKKLPIVVGGTGLYIRALIDGFFEQPDFSGSIRKELEGRFAGEGKDSLYEELQRVDPKAASTMDASKHRRVIRALEVYYETGIPISQFHQSHEIQAVYDAEFTALQWERESLYGRINARVDEMIRNGFLDEVRRIQHMGYDERYQSLQTVGYKEAFSHLRGEIPAERMIELMKQNTRRFAKRQMTWFRKEERIRWYRVESEEDIDKAANRIIRSIQKRSTA